MKPLCEPTENYSNDQYIRYRNTMHLILSKHILVLILEMDVLSVGHISFSV